MKYQVKVKTPYDEYKISNITQPDIDELTNSLQHNRTFLFLKIYDFLTDKEDILVLQGDVLKNTTFIIKEIEND